MLRWFPLCKLHRDGCVEEANVTNTGHSNSVPAGRQAASALRSDVRLQDILQDTDLHQDHGQRSPFRTRIAATSVQPSKTSGCKTLDSVARASEARRFRTVDSACIGRAGGSSFSTGRALFSTLQKNAKDGGPGAALAREKEKKRNEHQKSGRGVRTTESKRVGRDGGGVRCGITTGTEAVSRRQTRKGDEERRLRTDGYRDRENENERRHCPGSERREDMWEVELVIQEGWREGCEEKREERQREGRRRKERGRGETERGR
ncbi:hypothetical protein NDU88_003280 [Pleurodeles waltl]|uniref:Uncharacterized protein n=1 Tax=Pleurodeles waltl TaxID=8319 RepID=A0AAV7MQ41_PLEWA|nr:hypothetical protein NDU88_003280 [Pleurodeles waltl]